MTTQWDMIYSAAKADYEEDKAEQKARRESGELTTEQWETADDDAEKWFQNRLNVYMGTDPTHVMRVTRWHPEALLAPVANMNDAQLVNEFSSLTYISGKAGVMPTQMAVRFAEIAAELFKRGYKFEYTPGKTWAK